MFKVGDEVVFVADDPYKWYKIGDSVTVTGLEDRGHTVRVIDSKAKVSHWDAGYLVLASEYSAADNIKEPTALEVQHGGGHYKGMKIQPVEFIHANNIGYMEGNVVKYVTRWQLKNGIEDLHKARHYIDLLIELETRKNVQE